MVDTVIAKAIKQGHLKRMCVVILLNYKPREGGREVSAKRCARGKSVGLYKFGEVGLVAANNPAPAAIWVSCLSNKIVYNR